MGKSNKQAEVGQSQRGQQPVVRREVQQELRWEQGCLLALPAQPVPWAAAVGALRHKNDKNSTGLQSPVFEGKTKPATLPFSPNQTLPFPYLQPFKGERSFRLMRGTCFGDGGVPSEEHRETWTHNTAVPALAGAWARLRLLSAPAASR